MDVASDESDPVGEVRGALGDVKAFFQWVLAVLRTRSRLAYLAIFAGVAGALAIIEPDYWNPPEGSAASDNLSPLGNVLALTLGVMLIGLILFWRTFRMGPAVILKRATYDRVFAFEVIVQLELEGQLVAADAIRERWPGADRPRRATSGSHRHSESPKFAPRDDLADAYATLGVIPPVEWKDARQAYRRAAKSSHPDRGGTPEEFRRVTSAWEIVERSGTQSSG